MHHSSCGNRIGDLAMKNSLRLARVTLLLTAAMALASGLAGGRETDGAIAAIAGSSAQAHMEEILAVTRCNESRARAAIGEAVQLAWPSENMKSVSHVFSQGELGEVANRSHAQAPELALLVQTDHRDTGEILHGVSAPIHVLGRHWGGFRVGLRA